LGRARRRHRAGDPVRGRLGAQPGHRAELPRPARTPERTPAMTDAASAEPAASTDGLRYADAMAELDAILHELERGDVDLDRLAGQVRRAAELVRFCRGRLDDTRTEVT